MSFFTSHSLDVFNFFLYLIFLYALSIRSNVSEQSLSLFSSLLIRKELLSSSTVGYRISIDAFLIIRVAIITGI